MNLIKLVFGFWNKQVDCAIQTHELTEASVLQAIADAFDSLGEDEMLTAVSHVFTKGYKKVFDREGIKLLVCVHCFSHFLLSHKPFQEKKNSSSLLSIHHNFWANHFNETKVHFILQSSFVVTQISIASFPLWEIHFFCEKFIFIVRIGKFFERGVAKNSTFFIFKWEMFILNWEWLYFRNDCKNELLTIEMKQLRFELPWMSSAK